LSIYFFKLHSFFKLIYFFQSVENKCLLMILMIVQQWTNFTSLPMRHEIMFFGLQHMLPKPHYEFCCPGNKRMSFFRPRRFGSDTILQSIPRSRRTIHSFHRMHHDWNIHSSRTYLSSFPQHCNFQLGICTTVFLQQW